MGVLNYVFCAVNELTDENIEQYVKLFNVTFPEPLSKQEFLDKFTRRMGTNAYFVFLRHETHGIVGSIGAIEVPYWFEGRQYRFALTVDGMIASDHRSDWLALKRMHDLLTTELERLGFVYLFTKPNNNSYLYLKKLIGLSDIGELTTYGFLLRPFRRLNRRLAWLDVPWMGLVKAIAWLCSRGTPVTETGPGRVHPLIDAANAEIRRTRDAAFLNTRYGDERYRWIECRGHIAIYTIRRYSGWSACFVLEASQFGFRDWMAMLNYLLKRHGDIEVVLRIVGRPRTHLPLIRIPAFLLPNKFHVVGKSIGKTVLPQSAILAVDISDFEMV